MRIGIGWYMLMGWGIVMALLLLWPIDVKPKATPAFDWKQQFDLLRCPEQSNTTVSGVEIDMQALKLRCSYQPVKEKR